MRRDNPKRTRILLGVGPLVALLVVLGWPTILSYQNKRRIANLYLQKANTAMRLDQFDVAIYALEKLSIEDPNDRQVQTELLKARIFKIGEKYDVLDRIVDSKELDKAEADCALLLEGNQKSAELHALRGIIYAIRDHPALAFQSYQKAAELDPHYPNVSNYWGYSAYQWQYPADVSVKKFREAIELDANYGMPRINLALLAVTQGKFEDAVKILSEAEQVTNDNEGLYLLWGNCLLKWGQQLKKTDPLESERKIYEALDKYRMAEAIKPDMPDLHLNKGVALSSLGRQDPAAAAYKKAVELEPDFLVAHENLSQLLYQRKDLDGALSEIQLSLRVVTRVIEQFESRKRNTSDEQAQKILAQWIEDRRNEKNDLEQASREVAEEAKSLNKH